MFPFPPYLQLPINLFSQQIFLIKKKQSVVDFKPVQTTVSKVKIDAVVQPKSPETLKVGRFDSSLEYLLIHAKVELEINNEVEYKNKNYKIIQKSNWLDYGYCRCVAEEQKR